MFDAHGVAVLDGMWEFYPGDHNRGALDDLTPEQITVPGLWEAQGHLELDGVAWYRRFVDIDDSDFDPHGYWTLRFAAVMDMADVYLNGELIASHEHPFTPFEIPVTGALHLGRNVLDVRVTDPALDDPIHIRSAHGKQGWANHVFPSRPSLYMTYGGIWQTVTLRRHGPVVTRDVFINSDPDDLVIDVEVINLADHEVDVEVGIRTVGWVHEESVPLAPQEARSVTAHFGATPAERWTPASPDLHHVLIDVRVGDALSDRRRLRFGLRTIRLEGTRLYINDEPYRMKSVLVQGFRAEQLYAEGTREQIVEEVQAAKAMGFNTLRLHIKAFDPVYLDVCDELGMFVHSDLPVAEPIAHEELGDGSDVSRRAVEAIQEQVRRDRNHPSIILWSSMNELALDREGARGWDVYEQFARTLYAATVAVDPTTTSMGSPGGAVVSRLSVVLRRPIAASHRERAPDQRPVAVDEAEHPHQRRLV